MRERDAGGDETVTITSDEVLFTLRLDGGPNNERLSDRALDQLRTLIITLELEPGSLDR